MIKKIIHCADIHCRNFQRNEEYLTQLTKFIEKCKEIAEPYDKSEIRIVICGDLYHNKNSITPEVNVMTSSFIRQLQEIATVICIAGNHDLIVNNTSRKDAITALFETACFENAYLLDYTLEQKSGVVVDDNVTWAVYSIYDSYNRPAIEEARNDKPDNKIIGLFHGMIVGCTLHNGFIAESGVSNSIFDGCDFVIAGDIHKRQVLKYKGTDIVYSGSLIQQNYGETISQHGFVVWDLENNTHEFVDIDSEFGMYDIEINDIEEIRKGTEVLKNL